MNKPYWINFIPNENVGGSGSEDIIINAEPNYDNINRSFSFQTKQDNSNIIKNITIEQQYSEDIFNIGGSFAVSEIIYWLDTRVREFFITSQKVDNTPLAWTMENTPPSWMTVVVDNINSKITITGNQVFSNTEFTIILKQTITENIVTIKIYRKRPVMGYSAQSLVNTHSLNNGTIFIAANDGIYSNRNNPDVFEKEEIWCDKKNAIGTFIKHTTDYTWARACKFKTTVFFGCGQGPVVFNGGAWTRSKNDCSQNMILYWNDNSNRLENVWSAEKTDGSLSNDGLFENSSASAINSFLNVDDKVLYNVRRYYDDSQLGKTIQIKEQDKSWIPIDNNSVSGTSIGWLWVYNNNQSDCIINNIVGQEKILVDVRSTLRIWSVNDDTHTSDILGVIPTSFSFSGLCKDNDWYYVSCVYNPSYIGAHGYVVKFQINNNSVVINTITSVLIDTNYGGPTPGILKHENYIYIPLNNSKYACLIIDVTKQFIFSNFIFVPHNFSMVTTPPADDNTVGYSTCHPFVLDNRVYISSRGVSKIGSGTYSGIEKMKGIREIVNNDGNFFLKATNKSMGFYDKPFWTATDVYIPGDGLTLKYNKSNFSFDYVNYI